MEWHHLLRSHLRRRSSKNPTIMGNEKDNLAFNLTGWSVNPIKTDHVHILFSDGIPVGPTGDCKHVSTYRYLAMLIFLATFHGEIAKTVDCK